MNGKNEYKYKKFLGCGVNTNIGDKLVSFLNREWSGKS